MHACRLQPEQGTGNVTHNKASNIDNACMWLTATGCLLLLPLLLLLLLLLL